MTILIISGEEINDIMKIFKSLEESGLSIKGISKKNKNGAKEQKEGFLGMLLDALVASLLGNILTGKGKTRAVKKQQQRVEDVIQLRRYYQNEAKFNGVFSRNSLPKIKNGTYVINLDEYKSIETHWIDLYVNANNIVNLHSFGVEHILNQIKKSHRKQKYYNKYLQNTSIQFINMKILLYRIY